MSGTFDQRGNKPPRNKVGYITMEELEGLKLRANEVSEKTLEHMEKTKTKVDLHAKSRSRVANWADTAEKFLERRNAEHVKRLEDEEIERRQLDQIEYELQQDKREKTL